MQKQRFLALVLLGIVVAFGFFSYTLVRIVMAMAAL